MLYNLVTVGEAAWVILDELLDNTTVKEYVILRREDLVVDMVVQFYTTSTSSKAGSAFSCCISILLYHGFYFSDTNQIPTIWLVLVNYQH